MDTTVKNLLFILFMGGFISFFIFLYRIIRQGEKEHRAKQTHSEQQASKDLEK